MSQRIGMIAIPIEKGVLRVEASRISHVVVDNRAEKVQAFVHLESGEEFALDLADGDYTAGELSEQYNALIEAAS